VAVFDDRLRPALVWPYHNGMATSVVRSTYALDLDTVRTLGRLAERWGVSKSEALRRAVRHAAEQAAPKGQGALEALDALQVSLKLTRTKAAAWARAARSERRASAARREGRAR
jgi:hypothetical protein